VFGTMGKRSLIAIAVVAFVAASCGSADTYATVNGQLITRADVEALNVRYQDSATVPGEQLRGDLTQLIIAEAVATEAVKDFGATFTDDEITERLTNPPQRYAALFADAAGTEQGRANALQSLVRDAVIPTLVEEEHGSIDAYVAAAPQDVTTVCLRHIMTATAEESVVVAERLEAGEAFDEVLAEVSLDTTNPSGLLTINGQCPIHVGVVGAEFAQAAATAPLGEPTGPVASDAGFFHVIVVEERAAPSGAASAEQFMEQLDAAAASAIFNTWANDAVREADVDVASFIGRWSEAALAIAPPGDAPGR